MGIRDNINDCGIVYSPTKYRETEGSKVQQNAIDKAKGIIAKPMPRYWHDRHSVNLIEDPDEKRFQLSIVADKKPYFMRVIYPDLAKQYNTYIKTTSKNAVREFGMTIDELKAVPQDLRTERQNDFMRYYYNRMPVGMGDCVMNKICRRFEDEFDKYLRTKNSNSLFDYEILKSDEQYSDAEYRAVSRLYDSYCVRVKQYAVVATYERIAEDESDSVYMELNREFLQACETACPNSRALCNIVLDLCYSKNSSKKFAWEMCGEEIIKNLLEKNNHQLQYPTLDAEGDIYFSGKTFRVETRTEDDANGDCVE